MVENGLEMFKKRQHIRVQNRSFLILDRLEDKEWMSHLVKITVQELPEPKIKSKKKNVSSQKKVRINKK